MADTSDAQLAFVVDANPLLPLPNGLAWNLINFVSENIDANVSTVQSKTIRPDASLKEVRRTSIDNQGNIAVELSRDPEFDVLMAAALRGSWVSNVLKAGVGKTVFAFEEKVLEGANPFYTRYRGVMLNGFELNAAGDGIVDVTFPAMGLTGEDDVAVTTGATYTAAGTTAVLAGLDFVGWADSGLTTQLDVQSVSFSLTNNARSDAKLGQITPRAISWGKRVTTVKATLFFASREAFQAFKADAPRSIQFGFKDPASTAKIAFYFGRVRNTVYNQAIAGENTTITVDMEFTVTFDPTSATDFQITRTP